jgi:NHLM bacteriocin system ABC transporter ATP-binding protein
VSTTQTARLKEQGAILNLKPGVPFPIDDAGKMWLVLEGKLDLFVAEMHEGDALGARHHLMRVETGNPVFGFQVPGDSPLGVIANATEGSRVVCLRQEQLRGSKGNNVGLGGPLVDKWLENLSSALSPKPGPKHFLELIAGETAATGDAAMALLPLSGVLWIRQLEGDLRLLGDPRTPPLDRGTFFPVTRAVWLACTPQARVECFDTASWQEVDPEWSGLATFQNRVLAYLVEEHRRQEQQERERLAAVAAADAAVLEGSLQTLARPVEAAEGTLPEVEAGDVDPLLRVCRMVARATGFDPPAFSGRLQLPKHMEPVKGLAEFLRIRTRQVILKGKWWTGEGGAMVGFQGEDKRPVALLPGARGYHMYDPATRRKSAVTEKSARGLNAFAYVLYRPFPPQALTLGDILKFGLHGCRGDGVAIVLMGIAAALLGSLIPIFTGIIFDTLIPGAERRRLAELSMFLVISAVASVMFMLTRGLATLRLQSRMEAAIQAAVWDRLLSLPVPFFRRYTSGDLARRSLGISQIRETLTGSALSSILTGIFSTTSCGLMFYYSWRLALITTALVFVLLLLVTLSGWFQVRILRAASELGGRLAGMTLQFINGVTKFRVAGVEARAFAVWARDLASQRVLSVKALRISNRVAVLQSAFPVLASAFIFGCAAWLMHMPDGSRLTTGEFLAFVAAFVQFSTGSLELSSALIAVLNVVPLYERAKPILTCLPEVVPTHANPRELMGNISIHHVSFRYREDGPIVLRDLSYNIAAGEFIAFVGPSGTGKSTLFRLLLGFETPGSGAIYYDGNDLAGLDVQAVRRQIGTVLQNARLSTGSIFRNIAGEGAFTLDDAWEAARMAGLEEDVRAMPMGMHTMVSEGGGGLSGGQRQRLLIARAIVNKPRIFFFDEATSALDNCTQAIVSQSLRSLNATRVVIAHRLSTVSKADRICVLDKGSIVQSGTYDELMQQEGLFAVLAKRQLA